MELEVLERVVLRAHGQVVALRPWRDPARDGPGGEHAIVLEAQVPVQAARVVLLDDEARRGRRRGRRGAVPGRLGRRPGVALVPVALQPIGHRRVIPDRPDRRRAAVSAALLPGTVASKWTPIRSCSTTPPGTSSWSWSRASTTSTPHRPCASASTRRSVAAAGSSSTSPARRSSTRRCWARCWTLRRRALEAGQGFVVCVGESIEPGVQRILDITGLVPVLPVVNGRDGGDRGGARRPERRPADEPGARRAHHDARASGGRRGRASGAGGDGRRARRRRRRAGGHEDGRLRGVHERRRARLRRHRRRARGRHDARRDRSHDRGARPRHRHPPAGQQRARRARARARACR